MKIAAVTLALLTLFAVLGFRAAETPDVKTFDADSKNFQYVGRVDFTDPKKPKFWSPGVYVKAKFSGKTCDVLVNDEELYGKSHNYVEIAVDDNPPMRVQTTGKENAFSVGENLPDGAHVITICKDTESGIGYLEFVGLRCEKLLTPPKLPKRKLEFIGDSITCGAGSDQSKIACDKGQWYDQHNAYESYGPKTARNLDAQWQISAVSGIGLMHSCCNMKETMPDVFGKLTVRQGGAAWDFKRYQPDAVTICLGQNDGIQDEATFVENYLTFVKQIRADYPKAQIICLTSPMGDAKLTAALKERLTQVVARRNADGDKNVHTFFFSRSFNGGCGGHPDLAQHAQIADELTAYLKTTLGW